MQTSLPHLSSTFFSQVTQLAIIQQPFHLSQISNQLTQRDIFTEFELMRAITETKQHNRRLRSNNFLENKKNRYSDQSIYDHSRVKIKVSQEDEKKGKDYFNANYVYQSDPAKCTIITQAPLPSTIQDFFTTIQAHQITCVVMLCNVLEGGKVRCHDYINESDLYEEVNLLKNEETEGDQNTEIRKIIIKGKNGKTHEYVHVFFKAWPDKLVPENPSFIDTLMNECLKHKRVMIHCSAGLGRSGVVASLFYLLNNFLNGQDISVFKAVRELRQDRFKAVQNAQQYRFIYEYLEHYSNKYLKQ